MSEVNGEVPHWDMEKLEFFSEDKVAFLNELKQHPLLIAKIQAETVTGDIGEVIGQIAAYCNIGMEGLYSPEDIENLYPRLTHKMRDMRKVRIH